MTRLWTSAVIGFFSILVSVQGTAADRPTEAFRAKHGQIITEIGQVEQKVGRLDELDQKGAKQQMNEIVSFFEQEIKPHAEKEEAVLYPAVDQRAGTGDQRFTETMRYEHGLVGKWIDELAKEAGQESPDREHFTRVAYNLTGVLRSHFRKEEEVFLPLLDRSMTQQEFEQQIISKMEEKR